MSGEELFGFIGDISGNEANLVAMDSVTRQGGRYFRYPVAGGPRCELKEGELEYVRESGPELSKRWGAGDIIWFAGRHLVTRAMTDAVLRPFAASWTLTAQGHRIRTGGVLELQRWRDQYAAALSAQFHRYLMDPMERQAGQAERALELYLAVENTAVPRRFLNKAVFHFESLEHESYEFERDRAVLSRTFSSLEEFDASFSKLYGFLKSERLADIDRQLTDSVAGRPEQPARALYDAFINEVAWKRRLGEFDASDLYRLAADAVASQFKSIRVTTEVQGQHA